MKTYRVRVRIAGGRLVDIEIQAPDVHAALNWLNHNMVMGMF